MFILNNIVQAFWGYVTTNYKIVIFAQFYIKILSILLIQSVKSFVPVINADVNSYHSNV